MDCHSKNNNFEWFKKNWKSNVDNLNIKMH